MFCYKDISFCASSKICSNLDCPRNTGRPDFQPGTMPVCYISKDVTKCEDYKPYESNN